MSQFPRPRPHWLFALLDHLMLARPMILVPVWLFLLLGAWYGLGEPTQSFWCMPTRIVGALVNFTLLLSGVYLQNQIVDRDSDRLNHKLFLISEGIIPLARAKWLCVALYILPMGLSLLWSIPHFFVFVCSALLGLAYNTPPLHFKARPVLDVLSNGIGNGILNVLAGYTAVADLSYIPIALVQLTVPYALAVGAVFTSTAIPDIAGDRSNGDRGTAVWLDEVGASWLVVTMMAAAGILAWLWGGTICLIGAAASLPGFVVAAILKRRFAHIFAYQWSTLCFALVTGYIYPWFILFLAVVIFTTKWYYQHRFALQYPF